MEQKFKIGDVVCLKIDPNVKFTVNNPHMNYKGQIELKHFDQTSGKTTYQKFHIEELTLP